MDKTYPNTQLYINGIWKDADSSETIEVINPAFENIIGKVAHARKPDLEEAIYAADIAFKKWKSVNSFERYKILQKAASLLRERANEIARIMTIEQGKPIGESLAEVNLSADIIDWLGEEARRTYGRLIPSRSTEIYQMVVKEPLVLLLDFSPWNFPINQD